MTFFLQKKWGIFWGKKIRLNYSTNFVDFLETFTKFSKSKNGEIKTNTKTLVPKANALKKLNIKWVLLNMLGTCFLSFGKC